MAYAPVAFAFKQIVTAAKLTQLFDNIVAHDHRADGSQGAPLSGIPWTDLTGSVNDAAGWDVNWANARKLLDGTVVQYDFGLERTGADLVPNADSGGMANVALLTAIPVDYRPLVTFVVPGISGVDFPGWVSIDTAGAMNLLSSMPGRTIVTGSSLIVRQTVWID